MMKCVLSCILLLLLVCPLFSQTHKVSVKLKDVSLEKVFEEIESISDYTFLFNDDLIREVGRLTLDYRETDIQVILEACLKGTGLSYQLIDHTFVLLRGLQVKMTPVEPEKEYIAVSGWVVDEDRKPLPGVNVYVKNAPGFGIATDMKGYFEVKTQPFDVLVLSSVGYKSRELFVHQYKRPQTLLLERETQEIDEVQVVGFGLQRKISVIGSISEMDVEGKNYPVVPFSSMLAGQVSGIIGVQRNGEPGQDVSEFWVRGISTFGANDKALILIDGVERSSFDDLVPEDIESFSVLKDATATAVYGARGANGVILINTRRGRMGRLRIQMNARVMFSMSPRLPGYLRAYDYARLANEARLVRGESLLYGPEMYDVIRLGLDPDLYPDVNWQKELLKKWTWGAQANLNVSGGGEICRYYISLNYKTNDALYRESGLNAYRTNVLRKQYSFRTNLDFNVTSSTEVSVQLATHVVDMNRPGIGTTDSVWSMQAALNPLAVPVKYSTGQWPAYGNGKASPAVLMNQSGYVSDFRNSIESKVSVNQRLDFITSGLSAFFAASYDADGEQWEERRKMPALYSASGRDARGNLVLIQRTVEQKVSYHSDDFFGRRLYLEAQVDYSRTKGEHRFSGLLLYHQAQYFKSEEKDEISSIPHKGMGIAGRVTYSFQDIYFSEFNFGYNGSENFPKGQRFGFFPSFAVGWIVSGYEGFRRRLPFIRKLKLRYSFGMIGNDQIAGTRFPYLTYVSDAPGYAFGNYSENKKNGIAEIVIGAPNLAWEKSLKHNLGLELDLGSRFHLEIDYFREKRLGIFMKRNDLPAVMGLPSQPYGNVGKMMKQGIDGMFVYKGKIGAVGLELRGNLTVVKDKILEYDEPAVRYDYQKMKGKSYNQARGYVALGYFRDSSEIVNSPVQMGGVRPGDIKYKDVNGDGRIDGEDVVPIGYSSVPNMQYGIAGSFTWKNWDLSLFFRGAGRVSFFYGGTGYFPFSEGQTGNVLKVAGKVRNRWIPAWYSGNPATENPGARFPRLSYGYNKNNFVPSTHWLENGSYFRLKTLEVGYSFSSSLLKRVNVKKLRLSLMGDNLCIWDRVKLWDPEQASGNGAVYPIPRSFLVNLQIDF